MESVLAGFILIFLLIFGIGTFSQSLATAETALTSGWQSFSARQQQQNQTRLMITETSLHENGTMFAVAVANMGVSRITDMERWDMIVQYDDDQPMRRLLYLPYAETITSSNQWALTGIVLNNAAQNPEVFEPTIFNPGEVARFTARLAAPVGEGETLYLIIGLPSGSNLSAMATRNRLPTLSVNTGIGVVVGQTVGITNMQLQTTDAEQNAQTILYTVTVAPTQGTLSLPHSFTQAQIDAGLLYYIHTGTTSDSFQFSVTDGIDVIGNFTFLIVVI